jgi:hypothetical protein
MGAKHSKREVGVCAGKPILWEWVFPKRVYILLLFTVGAAARKKRRKKLLQEEIGME